jgi:CHRD domain
VRAREELMSRRTRLVLVVVGLAAVALVATSFAIAGGGNGKDKHGRETFSANLIGFNEVPSINTTGHAKVILVVDKDAQTITFKLDYADLSANPAAAHVHVGQFRVNGGVSYFFCGGGGKPACPAATSGSISGTVVPADIIGPTAQGFTAGSFDAVVDAMEAGVTYANMHTANFPGGEIRGQVGDRGDRDH